ncbi:MAG: hypothetical protein P8I94_11660 [Emcibacteraceae bacterium]|nr:hypothetical protein [Emcibacteraceae bacterium]
MRLNGLYEPGKWTGLETRDKTDETLRPRTWNTIGENPKWEIGGDFERKYEKLGTFKALFLLNGEDKTETQNCFNGKGSEEFEYNIENTSEKISEKIFRTSLTNSITDKQTLEWGGEVAINTVHGTFNNEERDTANDVFVLTNSDVVDIKENRYEIFANHTYDISVLMITMAAQQSLRKPRLK